ncbi:alpha/beta hydrolase [Nocardia abscessus]|uniref:alpha/beta hydrolase n=1 Tax=Nocardia abscessus TaxID=120957 RepID=UPI003CC80466
MIVTTASIVSRCCSPRFTTSATRNIRMRVIPHLSGIRLRSLARSRRGKHTTLGRDASELLLRDGFTRYTAEESPERKAVFFARLADGLAEAGVASLRFDLRGHGESEGRQEELTLSMILNDIRVAVAYLREASCAHEISLLGASFGGGICAYY